jgi:hypothetical protein
MASLMAWNKRRHCFGDVHLAQQSCYARIERISEELEAMRMAS